MKKFLNCFVITNIFIVVGMFLVFTGFAICLVKIAYADCANATVSIGACKVVMPICEGLPIGTCTSRAGAVPLNGPFRCNISKSGTMCVEGEVLAPCYNLFRCRNNGGICQLNTASFLQAYAYYPLIEKQCDKPCP
jgi:hypothetical protein